MGNSSKCRFNFAFLMLTALLVYVAYDFKINGSFERSNTARYLKKWKVYNYVQPVAINIERNILILKKQYDIKYGPTVNYYLDQVAKKYDTNIRPTVDPYLDQLHTVSKPYVNSLIENSILAYRAVEKYYLTYTRQLVIYLEKNVFTGSLSIDNIKIALNDTFEKFLKAYGDAYKWANDKISALIKS